MLAIFISGFALGISLAGFFLTLRNNFLVTRAIESLNSCVDQLKNLADCQEAMDNELEVIKFDLEKNNAGTELKH